MKTPYIYLMIILLISGAGCTIKEEVNEVIHDEKTGKPLRIQDAELKAKFNTQEKPGKWEKIAGDHVPTVKLIDSSGKIHIQASVPFSSNPDHYTELIILSDAQYSEISKITYAHFEKDAIAEFIVPKESKGLHYIIIKCNLHDMWIKDFVIPAKDKK